jgi:hypothetical protein
MTVTQSLYLVLYHVSSQVVVAGAMQVVALYAVTPCNLIGGQQCFRGICFMVSGISMQTGYIGILIKC